jgi:6-phosphogluconate dehydrogenase
MKIAVSGLGRMGGQIARKLAEAGQEVIAHNRSPGPVELAVKHGAVAAHKKDEVVKTFSGQRVVLWIMLPSEIMDDQLAEWLQALPAGSLIIDGGNSDYRETVRRAQKISGHGSSLVDIGTSGGVWGYENGFSMMAGGDESDFKLIEPVLRILASPSGAYHHFGGVGAGHFVKMVHNAIEYGMMESLAEGYQVLKDGPYKDLDLAAAGEVWQHSSVIRSWLNDLAREALAENPTLQGIEGKVAESGEARWALEVAKEQGIAMPAVQAAFDVRLASQKGEITYATKLLAAIRNKFGGHDINPQA